jgi:hypothetical protein
LSWLYFSNHEIGIYRSADDRSDLGEQVARAVTVLILSAIANAIEMPMADTIKTETMQIEEGKFMPESLQFESEPWTCFYTAGGIIRELRKASGKQNKHGSEGNMAHSDNVIDHHDDPCDVGSLPKDDPSGGTGLLGAPDCSNVMKLQMKINSETKVIEETEFKTFGGGSATANPSLATEWVKGKTMRKHWPSRTRVSSASPAFPHATLLNAARYFRNGRRLHLVGSPIF